MKQLSDYEESLLEVIETSSAIDIFDDWDDCYCDCPMKYIDKHKDFFNDRASDWEKRLQEGWHNENIKVGRF